MAAEPPDLAAAVRTLARIARLLDHTATGLSLPQYRLLALVDGGDERSSRLASRLTVSKPSVTALADGLVDAGYLERVREPGDARAVRLRLTPAGRDALHHASDVLARRLAPVLRDISDPDALVALLVEVGEALDRGAARPAAAVTAR